jgi:transcriptional regulator with XRE-family HTH domain
VQLKLDRDKMLRGREVLGYGVEKTAQEAGVSKNSVLRAEHGEDIRPVTARKIAGALGVRVADLLSEESEALKAEALPSLEPSFNDVIEERRLSRFADAIASAADEWAKDVLDVEKHESTVAGLVEAMLTLYENLAAGITREEWRALTSREQHDLETVMNKLAVATAEAATRLRASGHFDAQQEEMFEQRREEIREWTRKISA